MQDLKQAVASNAIAWILANGIVNENGSLIEFKDHTFLIDPYLDNTPRQAIRKCLHPQTRILTADLKWISLGDVLVGQRIFSVDENSDRDSLRRLRIGVVEKKVFVKEKAVRLTMSDGRAVVATPDHRFLCRRRGNVDTVWRDVIDVKIGDSIRSLTIPWNNTSSYESGWMAGFIDSEGNVRRRQGGGIEIQLCQSVGRVLERAKSFLRNNDFTFKDYKKNKTATSKKEIHFLRLSSSNDILRLLGITRPSRFTAKESLWEGYGLITGVRGNIIWPKVVKIEHLFPRKMVDIQTSTRTFVAEGFVSHNCAQIGWSTLAILRSFHLAQFAGANIIHTFPSRNISKDFVVPKVDPLIARNPAIKKLVGIDSVSLKQVADRYIYYRGSYEQTEAISISAHILINDEYDRSNQKVLKTYRSRLDDVKRERPELGWEWQFSNPSVPGRGVDALWQVSDQKHWFVRCRKCGHDWYLQFPENIDLNKKRKVCSKCRRALTRDDLIKGRWVRKYRDRKVSGYWISQMMVPWISAEKLIEDSKGDPEIFHNFCLGMPYVSKDTAVTRDAIRKCISPGHNPKTNVAIGVDNGVTKHYVVGNKTGIFMIGATDDWAEIEKLRNKYNAIMVIDALPYPNTPRKLADEYVGKIFLHYYQADRKGIGIIRWDQQVVRTDRTKVIDSVVGDIYSKDITFNMTVTELEELINHWGHVYRTIIETPQGISKPSWETIEGRDDHYAHATVLWRVALEQTIGQGGIVMPEGGIGRRRGHPIVGLDATVPALDLKEVAKRSGQKRKSWQSI